jgi:hypothetical protein
MIRGRCDKPHSSNLVSRIPHELPALASLDADGLAGPHLSRSQCRQPASGLFGGLLALARKWLESLAAEEGIWKGLIEKITRCGQGFAHLRGLLRIDLNGTVDGSS